jgi:hypothetical protein
LESVVLGGSRSRVEARPLNTGLPKTVSCVLWPNSLLRLFGPVKYQSALSQIALVLHTEVLAEGYSSCAVKNLALHLSVKIRVHLWKTPLRAFVNSRRRLSHGCTQICTDKTNEYFRSCGA